MTFAELKTAVEAVTGTNTNTSTRLNKGQLELARKINRTKSTSVTVTNGVFTIPSDCLQIQAIGWDNRELDLYDEDILPDYGTGTPLFWKQDGDDIKLVPSATGQAELVYKPRPAVMTNDTDTPELSDCEEAIIAYAIWKNYVEGEDEEEAVYWETEWYKRQQEWLELVSPKYKRKRRIKALSYI